MDFFAKELSTFFTQQFRAFRRVQIFNLVKHVKFSTFFHVYNKNIVNVYWIVLTNVLKVFGSFTMREDWLFYKRLRSILCKIVLSLDG